MSSPLIRHGSSVFAPTHTELFTALVDDAGLFPPEELSIGAAARRHRLDASFGSAILSHRFVCPGSRLAELRGVLNDEDRCDLSVISALEPSAVDRLVTAIQSDPRLSMAGLEGVLEPEWALARGQVVAALRWLPEEVPAFVEVPVRGGDVEPAIAFLATNRWSAKVRCGGLRADLFPTSVQLAGVIVACTSSGVAFKATAGLHHAVRYRDPATGFRHHGFLNILVAVARAVAGHDLGAVAEVLDSNCSAALVAETLALDPAAAQRVREVFISYGSCSTSDPIDDLLGLGLVKALSTP